MTDVLPRTFNTLLRFFYKSKFEREVKFGRFKIDFYSSELNLAFEYDGIQHYSVIQKLDSDLRKNELLIDEGIKLIRWPYYCMPTKDTCKHVFKEAFTEEKFKSMLFSFFNIKNESEMTAPGFHSTPNIPANFINQGIQKFLKELKSGPKSIEDQVRYSLQLYCKKRKNDNLDLVIPTYNKDFMQFYYEENLINHLNLYYPNLFLKK